MRALILAAGLGTRLRPWTDTIAKPMVPIGGRPLLEHLVRLVARAGVSEIGINLYHLPRTITDHFGDGRDFGVTITWSLEAELAGSAGAAKRLEAFLDRPFLVLYGDVLTDVDLRGLAAAHERHGGVATLALNEVDDPSRVGIVEMDASGRITRFLEKPGPGVTESRLANAGLYVLDPAVLAHVPPDVRFDFGADLFPALLAAGLPMYGVPASGYVLDIGSPERYAQACADADAGRVRLQAARPC